MVVDCLYNGSVFVVDKNMQGRFVIQQGCSKWIITVSFSVTGDLCVSKQKAHWVSLL